MAPRFLLSTLALAGCVSVSKSILIDRSSQPVPRLREESGKLGANAVYIRTMEDPGTGERVASALLGTESDRDSDAIALWCPKALGTGRRSETPSSFDPGALARPNRRSHLVGAQRP